ncbi:MAG: DUF1573 domain-containing protein [Candidatus Aenigmatarchaeota archaeon]
MLSKKLILLLIVPVILLSGCTSVQMEEMGHQDNLKDFEISPTQLSTKINNKENFKLLDVREDNEYEESHIDYNTLLLSVNSLSQENLDEVGLEKTDEIIVYCGSGRRSETAYNTLKALGYTNVKSLGGGIIHWGEEGYPVETGSYSTSPQGIASTQSAMIEVDIESHDFGEVPQFGGTVSTEFVVKNTGSEDLIVDYISTSCGCTTAEMEKKNLNPGEETLLKVVFDPDFHEEPIDRFSRTVFVGSNDPLNPEIEMRVWVDIIEGV